MGIIETWKAEAPVIAGAKWSFGAAVAMTIVPIGGLIWLLSTTISSSHIQTLEERIAYKDDQIAGLTAGNLDLEERMRTAIDLLKELLARVETLEETVLVEVLGSNPSSVEVFQGDEADGADGQLQEIFEQSGWTVARGRGTGPIEAFYSTGVVLKPTDPAGAETLKSALDAAEIPYDLRSSDGGPDAFWVESWNDLSATAAIPR